MELRAEAIEQLHQVLLSTFALRLRYHITL
jgi:hypothetical protein